jgi:TusA-related sulfurtransferase
MPSTPVPTNTAATAPATAAPNAVGHGRKGTKAGKAKGAGQAKLAPGESVLLGTVGSVSGTQLTITPDSGSQVTFTTTNTKIAGGTKAITDLKPGERIEVVVKDGAAVAVRIPQVHDTGTITNLNGTQATLVEADGQTVTLDLSGIGQPPANGNVVVVTGSVTDGGRTVQVSKVTPVAGTG